MNKQNEFIYGDFYTASIDVAVLPFALLLAVSTTLISYLIVSKLSSKASPKISINISFTIISIFLLNLFIVLLTNIGVVNGEVSYGYLFILMAIFPIGYLITICYFGQQSNFKLIFVSLIYIVIGLYQTFLGPIFHVLFLSFIRANKKRWFFLSIIIPIIVLAPILIKYKFEARGQTNEDLDDILVISTLFTGRLTTVSTFQYALEQPEQIAKFCDSTEYKNVFVAAMAPIVPRDIIGIQKLKTFNNCLIEYRLQRDVENYSVNSPWFLNIYLLWIQSVSMMIIYVIFTLGLVVSLIGLSNYLFGYNSIIFLTSTIPGFLVSGNVAYLVIPIYFLILMVFYNKLKKSHLYRWNLK